MHKEIIEMAGICVEMIHEYELLSNMFKDYIVNKTPIASINVTNEDILAEKENDEYNSPFDYLESLAFYRKFASFAANHDCILFHCSAVEISGYSYLFSGKSGSGKSTHRSLFQKYIPGVHIINDDKPLLKYDGDDFICYPTPYDGKERLSSNIHAPLRGIMFIKQGSSNKVKLLDKNTAFSNLYMQTFKPYDKDLIGKVIDLVILLNSKIPVYEIECDISKEAVDSSNLALTKGIY